MGAILISCPNCDGGIEKDSERCTWCDSPIHIIDGLSVSSSKRKKEIVKVVEDMATGVVSTTTSLLEATRSMFSDLSSKRPWWKFW